MSIASSAMDIIWLLIQVRPALCIFVFNQTHQIVPIGRLSRGEAYTIVVDNICAVEVSERKKELTELSIEVIEAEVELEPD